LGAYTAAAVASIAFGQRAVVVDGNVERVVARHHALDAPLPGAKTQLRALTDALTPQARAGDFAQAMMDLGATICTPRSPACGICPVAADCAGRLDPKAYPVKATKKARPERQGLVWWMERNGQVWLVRRPESGMLGGMLALPSDDWDGGVRLPGLPEGGEDAGSIRHVFTHFALTLEIRVVEAAPGCTLPEGGQWWPVSEIAQAGLPSLFAKVAAERLKGRTP
jgi:A/G-specific adenine glycosylase